MFGEFMEGVGTMFGFLGSTRREHRQRLTGGGGTNRRNTGGRAARRRQAAARAHRERQAQRRRRNHEYLGHFQVAGTDSTAGQHTGRLWRF